MKVVFIFLGILCLDLPADKVEKEIKELNDHIRVVNAQLERLEKQNIQASEKHKDLSERIPEMELQRAKMGQERERTGLQIKLVQAEIVQNRTRQDDVKKKLSDIETLLGGRLKALYKRGPLGYTEALLKETEIEEMVSSFYYVEHITKKDRDLFFDFLGLQSQLTQAEADLTALELQEKEKIADLDQKNLEMGLLLKKRKEEISILFKKSKERQQLLERLSQEKKELTELIGQLQNGEVEKGKTPHIPITHYKGRLEWPADGSILRNYGVFKDAQFSTKRKQNGIDIAVSKGQDIVAVYGGQVIFADWFKSYGNLIIIDHGRSFVSFYAHNDTLLVQKGDVVERNQKIAEAGDSGSLEGPFLHFEIREAAKAEDPLDWLKKRKKR